MRRNDLKYRNESEGKKWTGVESFEKRMANLEYYQKMLIKMADAEKYPFFVSVMKEGL